MSRGMDWISTSTWPVALGYGVRILGECLGVSNTKDTLEDIGRWMTKWMNECMHGWMNDRMDEEVDGWMDEGMDGWMDGWMDERWMGGGGNQADVNRLLISSVSVRNRSETEILNAGKGREGHRGIRRHNERHWEILGDNQAESWKNGSKTMDLGDDTITLIMYRVTHNSSCWVSFNVRA